MGIVKRITSYDFCVYWAPSPPSYGRRGHTSRGLNNYLEPVQLPCRWTDKVSSKHDDIGQSEDDQTSEVFLRQPVAAGGVLWHGLLVNRPASPPAAGKILTVRQIPDFRNKETLYVAML